MKFFNRVITYCLIDLSQLDALEKFLKLFGLKDFLINFFIFHEVAFTQLEFRSGTGFNLSNNDIIKFEKNEIIFITKDFTGRKFFK